MCNKVSWDMEPSQQKIPLQCIVGCRKWARRKTPGLANALADKKKVPVFSPTPGGTGGGGGGGPRTTELRTALRLLWSRIVLHCIVCRSWWNTVLVGSDGRSHGPGEQGFNQNQHQISCNNTGSEISDETSTGLNLHEMNYSYMLKAVGPLGCCFKFSLRGYYTVNQHHWFIRYLLWFLLWRMFFSIEY